MIKIVGEVTIIKHNPGPCRYCKKVFENECCGLDRCPHCGTPVALPLNYDVKKNSLTWGNW